MPITQPRRTPQRLHSRPNRLAQYQPATLRIWGNWIDQLFMNQLDPTAHPFFAEICHLRVASHVLIRREGEIVQYVPFHLRAFHAGVSHYRGRERCNDFSIGIEIEGTDFEAFTAAQYQQLEALLPALMAAYPTLSLQHITGHEHIALVA